MSNPSHLVAGQTLSAEEAMAFGSIGTTFTPALEASTTNPTLGTSPTQAGMWWQQNELVHLKFIIQFGTGAPTAGSGTYYLILPAAAPILNIGISPLTVGSGMIFDASGNDDRIASYSWTSGSDADRIQINAEGTTGAVAHNNPWTWTIGDALWGYLTYPGDF